MAYTHRVLERDEKLRSMSMLDRFLHRVAADTLGVAPEDLHAVDGDGHCLLCEGPCVVDAPDA